jgi:hypothetical protein
MGEVNTGFEGAISTMTGSPQPENKKIIITKSIRDVYIFLNFIPP